MDEHRARVLAGMTAALAEVSYPELAIADIVKHARVSRRTFYEQFESKEDCLLALYEALSERVLVEIEAAIEGVEPGAARIIVGADVYLAALQSHAPLVRTLLIEILQVGPRGLAVRRRVMQRFADLLLRQHASARGKKRRVSPVIATALVGGINELVLEAVEEQRFERLGTLAGDVAEVVRALLGDG